MAEQQQQNPNSNAVVGNADALPEGSNPVKMGEEANPQEEQLFIENTSTSSENITGAGTTITPAQTTGNQVVGNSGIDPTRLAGELVGDPSQFMGNDMTLATQVEGVDPNTVGTNIDGSDPNYAMDTDALNVVGTTGVVNQSTGVTEQDSRTYTAETAADRVAGQDMDAATGELKDEALVDAEGFVIDVDDVESRVSGFASQDISKVIDTSTIAGKLLAEQLGEGNYTDSKATVKGQMDILSKEFVDSNGNPKIPTWCAGLARQVSRTMAFKGITGTAGVAAMAQACMEASLPIAQQDAKFYQTVTLENLSNKQESTINTANIISKMEMVNLDARENAAVVNSKNFMAIDLANLDNEQQANVINNQNRVQSILEDQKVINTQRLFTAESQNDFAKFYDNLSANINMFNTEQLNGMEQFNVSELNSIYQFNSQLENGREQFYKDMQYNIDVSNTKWRQSIALQENEQLFEANARDVQNKFNLSTEQLNRIWDRQDSLMDWAWKSSENEKDRESKMALAKMELEWQKYSAKKQAQGSTFSALGTVAAAAIQFW
jgi:hypothetical protein|tara:strand:- start:2638 stop:4290 length:1653 start_codon:yes stop_codon:yes gene_type:complete